MAARSPRGGRCNAVPRARRWWARAAFALAFLAAAIPVDATTVARQAVDRGADLLGVAGGDGTQALVAVVAAEYGLPFLVISAGTRNPSDPDQ